MKTKIDIKSISLASWKQKMTNRLFCLSVIASLIVSWGLSVVLSWILNPTYSSSLIRFPDPVGPVVAWIKLDSFASTIFVAEVGKVSREWEATVNQGSAGADDYHRVDRRTGMPFAIGEYGFPFRAVEWSVEVPFQPSDSNEIVVIRGGIVLDKSPAAFHYYDENANVRSYRHNNIPQRIVAWSPKWGGIFLNMTIWTLIVFSISMAGYFMRTQKRIRRGLCPRCKYAIPSSVSKVSVCPECGLSY